MATFPTTPTPTPVTTTASPSIIRRSREELISLQNSSPPLTPELRKLIEQLNIQVEEDRKFGVEEYGEAGEKKLSTEYLIFVSRATLAQDSTIYLPKGIHVLTMDSLNTFYDVFGEGTSFTREEFLAKLADLPFRMEYEDETVIYVEQIFTYHNVPEHRSVNEIMSAIFCAAAVNGLMKCKDIRRGPALTEVLMDPKGILNPEKLDWNSIPNLITFLVDNIEIPASLDLTDSLKVKKRVKKVNK